MAPSHGRELNHGAHLIVWSRDVNKVQDGGGREKSGLVCH